MHFHVLTAFNLRFVSLYRIKRNLLLLWIDRWQAVWTLLPTPGLGIAILIKKEVPVIFSKYEGSYGRLGASPWPKRYKETLANHFRGPGSIPSTGYRRVNQTEKCLLPCLMLLYSCEPHLNHHFSFKCGGVLQAVWTLLCTTLLDKKAASVILINSEIDTAVLLSVAVCGRPYGHYFASVGVDRTARLWSTDHHQPLRLFAGHLADVDVRSNSFSFFSLTFKSVLFL